MPENKKRYKTYPCIHNENVDCRKPGEGCDKCGWKPEVSQARLNAILGKPTKG